MKKLLRPVIDHFNKYYEKTKFCTRTSLFYLLIIDKAPRARSKKMRRFDHVDLTKEFEMRQKKREAEKL